MSDNYSLYFYQLTNLSKNWQYGIPNCQVWSKLSILKLSDNIDFKTENYLEDLMLGGVIMSVISHVFSWQNNLIYPSRVTLLSPLWSLISWSTLPSMNIFVWPRRTLPSLSLPRAPLLATLPSPSQCVTSKPASLCLNSLVLPLSLAKILGLETERIPRLFVLYRSNKPIF